jgi:hypothetical protein
MAEIKRECVVQRATGYTVMSNYHLRDKTLGLKAKGLLSVMLSLPEDWDYTIAGLAVILGEGKHVIRTAVQELEKSGYITRQQLAGEGGKFGGNQYIIREFPEKPESSEEACTPLSNFPTTEKPMTENPMSENCTEIITDEQTTDEHIPPKSPEEAAEQPKGKRHRRNRDKTAGKNQPTDLLDDGKLADALVAQVDALSKEFPMERELKNRLYQIALHWYTPRTLASKHAAPPVHTALGISNLFRKLARGAAVIGIDAAVEVFYDALSRGHTDIHDERFKVGYKAPERRGSGAAPSGAEGMGERMC